MKAQRNECMRCQYYNQDHLPVRQGTNTVARSTATASISVISSHVVDNSVNVNANTLGIWRVLDGDHFANIMQRLRLRVNSNSWNSLTEGLTQFMPNEWFSWWYYHQCIGNCYHSSYLENHIAVSDVSSNRNSPDCYISWPCQRIVDGFLVCSPACNWPVGNFPTMGARARWQQRAH